MKLRTRLILPLIITLLLSLVILSHFPLGHGTTPARSAIASTEELIRADSHAIDSTAYGAAAVGQGIALEGYNALRGSALRRLQDMLQRSFVNVQHQDCSQAKYFVCDLGRREAGFGSRIHEIVFCHFLAYALNRILIVRNFKLGELEEHIVDGFTTKCSAPHRRRGVDIEDSTLYNSNNEFVNSNRNLGLPSLYHPVKGSGKKKAMTKRLFPVFLPGSVPLKLAEIVEQQHLDPALWYIGQSVHFLVGRTQPKFKQELTSLQDSLGLIHPFVGIHIRHGDKIIREAKFISSLEYMKPVEEYFKLYHPHVTERRVYVATDDPNAIDVLKKGFPQGYKFISRPLIAKSAGSSPHNGTYTRSALLGLLTDIFLLIESDFIVCTMSSNICRLLHELRQAKFPSDSELPLYNRTVSMDSRWSYASTVSWYKSRRTMAIAKRNVTARQIGTTYFVELKTTKWYRIDTRPVSDTDGSVYHVSLPEKGFAMKDDLYIFPLRTNLTDPSLEASINSHKLKGLL